MRYGTYYRYALIKKLRLTKYIRLLDNWLDIGCYDGAILQAIDVLKKVGVDLDPIKRQNIPILKAVAEYLPFQNKVFKIITAFDVLEHIKNDRQVISQVKGKLKKGGIFIFTVPHKYEKIIPRLIKNWLIFHRWKHIRLGYTEKELVSLFSNEWKLKIVHWDTRISSLLYFPLQLIWKFSQEFAKRIINMLIQIEFIRTKKSSSHHGHLVVIARKIEK